MSTKSDHPITPPPWLVKHWDEMIQRAIEAAFQAGADQELEACCEWVEKTIPSWVPNTLKTQLRAARRPKPKSLKEQALETLKYPKDFWSEAEVDTIRLALEALPND